MKYLSKNRMKYFKIYLLIFFIQQTLISCKVKNDKISSFERLIQSNEIQRTAHMENNAELLVSQIADSMYSISNGQIELVSNQDTKEKFEKYFSLVKYTSWDDIRQPMIEISEDGKSASVNYQKWNTKRKGRIRHY